jgi:hypothetical protein
MLPSVHAFSGTEFLVNHERAQALAKRCDEHLCDIIVGAMPAHSPALVHAAGVDKDVNVVLAKRLSDLALDTR